MVEPSKRAERIQRLWTARETVLAEGASLDLAAVQAVLRGLVDEALINQQFTNLLAGGLARPADADRWEAELS